MHRRSPRLILPPSALDIGYGRPPHCAASEVVVALVAEPASTCETYLGGGGHRRGVVPVRRAGHVS